MNIVVQFRIIFQRVVSIKTEQQVIIQRHSCARQYLTPY
jgi:hypothetical protein